MAWNYNDWESEREEQLEKIGAAYQKTREEEKMAEEIEEVEEDVQEPEKKEEKSEPVQLTINLDDIEPEA